MHYVSKFVLFNEVYELDFKQQKWPSRPFKSIGNGDIR